MIFKFNQYVIDIYIDKTRRFYQTAKNITHGCNCSGCRNFEKAVSHLPQEVRAIFDKMGIDMKKAREAYINCKNSDGTLFYAGFYHICGKLLSGSSPWKETSQMSKELDEKKLFKINEDFEIAFQNEVDLLEKNFSSPVIQLEFFANIPWVLEEENTYL
ncbi:MAG: hypothetical protein ACI4PU_02185 [Intestinibacter sp.]